jgi:hypothetical protein
MRKLPKVLEDHEVASMTAFIFSGNTILPKMSF